MSDLRRKYDLTRESLRHAKLNTKKMGLALKKAKEDYDKAVENEAACERRFARVSAELDEALSFVSTIKNTKAPKLEDEPTGEVQTPEPAKPVEAQPKPATPLPPSQRGLVEAFPHDKPTGLQDLRQLLNLSDGGLNARIQKAVRAGLIERVGWGQYRLTDKGRAARGTDARKLKLVSSEGA